MGWHIGLGICNAVLCGKKGCKPLILTPESASELSINVLGMVMGLVLASAN